MEIKWVDVLVFSLSFGVFLCSELSSMEQSLFVCFEEDFIFGREVLCLFDISH